MRWRRERVDIYTDVSGAMTADPRRIADARTIDRASLAEMTELANHGAKVMHSQGRRVRRPHRHALRDQRACRPIAGRSSTKASTITVP